MLKSSKASWNASQKLQMRVVRGELKFNVSKENKTCHQDIEEEKVPSIKRSRCIDLAFCGEVRDRFDGRGGVDVGMLFARCRRFLERAAVNNGDFEGRVWC